MITHRKADGDVSGRVSSYITVVRPMVSAPSNRRLQRLLANSILVIAQYGAIHYGVAMNLRLEGLWTLYERCDSACLPAGRIQQLQYGSLSGRDRDETE